jgi:hypothetical protein
MVAETLWIGEEILWVMTKPMAAEAMMPTPPRMRIVVYPAPAAPAVFILLNPNIAMIRKNTVNMR